MTTTNAMAEEQPRPAARPEQIPADLETIRAKVSDLEQKASSLIQERPVVAVLAAVGIGYLVARLVSRASR